MRCERKKGGLVGQAHKSVPSDANEGDMAMGKGCIACHHFVLVDSSTSDWRCHQCWGAVVVVSSVL